MTLHEEHAFLDAEYPCCVLLVLRTANYAYEFRQNDPSHLMYEIINVYSIGFSIIKIALYKLSVLEKKIQYEYSDLIIKRDQINGK